MTRLGLEMRLLRAEISAGERLHSGLRELKKVGLEILERKRSQNISSGWLEGRGLGSWEEGDLNLVRAVCIELVGGGSAGCELQKYCHFKLRQKLRASVKILTGLILGVGENERPLLSKDISLEERGVEERFMTTCSAVSVEFRLGGGEWSLF